MLRVRRVLRLDKPPIRMSFRPANRRAERSLKQSFFHAVRVMAPTLLALSFAGAAHAQGTMDFSGAQTLMGTFKYIAIDQIHESTTNPRQTFEQTKLEELAESIRQHGLIQPITIRPNASGFEIVAGARRFRAAQLAELFSLPARIVELDDAAAMEWQLIELSIVVKCLLLVHWGPHVVFM